MIEGLIIPRSYNAYINKTDPVGVLNALQLPNVMDSTPTAGSNKPVTSSGIETALSGKQDVLTFDNAPTSGSDNPAKSGGIKSAIDTAETNAKEWATTAYFGTTTETGIIDITIDGLTALRQGMRIDVICPQIDDVSANGLQLRINGILSAEIKVLKNNSLQSIVSHTGYWEEAATSSTRVCDANTSLTLVYNGTEWLIKENPVLCAHYSTSKSYKVYADGTVEQAGEIAKGSDLAAEATWSAQIECLISYNNTNYNLICSAGDYGGGGEVEREDRTTRAVNSTTLKITNKNSSVASKLPYLTYFIKGY